MDKLAIINKALLKCGLPLAAAVEDCDWNAAFVFDACADEALRSYTWNFAQVFRTLAQAGTPPHGFRRSYAVPADCLRIIDIHTDYDCRSPKCRFVVSGKYIYTQAMPCHARYVSREVAVEDWPPDFCDAVACRIAQEIAPLSAQAVSLAPQLAQFYQLALATAQATDAREIAERVPLDHNILLARTGQSGHVGKRG